MIKPITGKRFSNLNDSNLRNQVVITAANTKTDENPTHIPIDDILELYLADDKHIINVGMDWNDEYECYKAVVSNGMNLKYVQQQTPDMCIAAVTENGWALQYVKNPTMEICKIAVSNNGMALEFVTDQTEEICKLAIENNPLSFRFVKDPSDEFTAFAVCEDTRNIRFARNITPKMCKELVDIDADIIFQLNYPPPELCLYVVRKDLRYIGSVRFNEVPVGPVLTELRSHLTMAHLKYGDSIKHEPDNDIWYLPDMVYSYKI